MNRVQEVMMCRLGIFMVLAVLAVLILLAGCGAGSDAGRVELRVLTECLVDRKYGGLGLDSETCQLYARRVKRDHLAAGLDCLERYPTLEDGDEFIACVVERAPLR